MPLLLLLLSLLSLPSEPDMLAMVLDPLNES